MALLHIEYEHDFDLYDACSDSYSPLGEYYDNIDLIQSSVSLEL